MNGDISLDDNIGLSGSDWQMPYSDTSVDAASLYDVPSGNDFGTMAGAITSGTDYGGAPGSQSSVFTGLENSINSALKNLLSGGVQVGTVAAKSAIGSAIAGANPGPSNSNVNLANKSLLQRATSMQQAFLGGIMIDPKTGGTNWWVVSGLVAVIVLIAAMIVRR